jgi:hypothetical protein
MVRIFQKIENPSFHKAYACCITDRSRTYTGCSIDRACTYACYRLERSCIYVFWSVQPQFRYMLITGKWYRLATGSCYKLVQVYSGISHSDSVAVVSSFDTYISG